MPITAIPLVPKDANRELNVIAMGRISTVHQDVENIEASYRYIEDHLGRIYQGPLKIKLLGEQASGMLTDRATIREAEDLVAGGKVDLVIAEDLSRIYRNPRHQYNFVQDCVDIGTRVICIGDNLDTSDENWEITMGAAALRHGLHIPDTRRRVRRTATHSFHRGGMVQKIRYGYRKLSKEEADSGQFGPKGLLIAKRPECTPIIHEMAERVLRGDRYAGIADWLNRDGVEPGRYVEHGRWTARLVVELLDDPVLSGTRTFRDTICRPIFKTGKHKSARNAEPEIEQHPELVHLSSEEQHAVRQEIARRRAEYRQRQHQLSRRQNVPRSRSIWPGQAATCAVCGSRMYIAGKHLRCKNSLDRSPWPCWNHVQVPVELTRQRVLGWLIEYAANFPPLRDALFAAAREGFERMHGLSRNLKDLDREIDALERKAANLARAIAAGGELEALVRESRAVQSAIEFARARKAQREQEAEAASQRQECPPDELLFRVAGTSYEFADLLRRVFPRFEVHPIQALDSGLVRPRAKILFRPAALTEDYRKAPRAEGGMEDVEAAIDLFDPPLHIRHLRSCVAVRDEHPPTSLKQIAARLGINHMIVKRALDYARRMATEGLTEPYRELRCVPGDASRWRLANDAPPPAIAAPDGA
jgi:DNA invertase Pin-like site-specific DNA recombinase